MGLVHAMRSNGPLPQVNNKCVCVDNPHENDSMASIHEYPVQMCGKH